ncbi:AraC family transcriptional regulator [Actinomadura kijaniata]|uniref:AraC family transcriptional regulator n=1 Tax=Actinomadura kijaniata TaxID=46161 RepID=UPI000836A96E|nr:AraC family transcriptional regulator [Actinomadura kijaniata]
MARATGGTPDVRRHDFRSGDPEVVHDHLRSVHTDHSCLFSGEVDGFECRSTMVEEDRFGVGLLWHSAARRIVVEPYPLLTVLHCLDGMMGMSPWPGDVEVAIRPGQSMLCGRVSRAAVRWKACTLGAVLLSPAAVVAEVGALAGVGLDDLRMETTRPVSAARERHWGSVVRHVSDGFLRNPEIRDSELSRTAMFHLLALTFVDTFPVPGRERFADHGQGPLVVRRAVEFIEEHAGDDITLVEIAAAAGVGVRALQQGMRRHRDTTPLAFLREVRMGHAHRELLRAVSDDGSTVAGIATRWGFPHAGRFSALYRERYGASPGDTRREESSAPS